MIKALPIAALLGVASVWSAPANKPLEIVRTALRQCEECPPIDPGSGFIVGETVSFSFQIAGYQISGESKQVDLVSHMEALDPQGVLLVPAMSDEIKTAVSPQDKEWLPIVRKSFLIPPLALGGEYRITIAVEDKLSSRSTKAEIRCPVRGRAVEPSDTLVARNFRFLRSEDDSELAEPPVYKPGVALWVRFDIVGYKLGEKNKIQVAYGVSVVNPASETIYSAPAAADETGESFYPKRYIPGTFSLNLGKKMRPGTYTIVLTLNDHIGNQTNESRHEFTIE
jgi:hypothetical protein